MSKMIFMSPEHVARMNEILAADVASKAACAALDRRWDMVYELSRGMDTVWWTMSFDPENGVSFSLVPPQRPGDILYRGEHKSMLNWMRRSKAGEAVEPMPLEQLGDPNGMNIIGPAFTAAQQVATLDTDIRVD
ncbi:MAG: hypothetical protein ACRETM_02695 [Stenotrophobium sp.]